MYKTLLKSIGANNDILHEVAKKDDIKRIREFFGKMIDWRNLNDLIPQAFKNGTKYKSTGKAGIFAGSLELVKEGNLKIKQERLFDEIYIKETKWKK